MIKINLLPEKIRSAEALKTMIVIGGLALGLVAVGIGGLYWSRQGALTQVQKELAKVEAEKNSPELNKIVHDVEEFAQQQKSLKERTEAIDSLKLRQVYFLKLVDMLPDLIPERVWLMSVEQVVDKSKRKIVLKGKGMSGEDVSKFYLALQNQAVFTDVSLDDAPKAEKIAVSGFEVKVVTFTISFKYEG